MKFINAIGVEMEGGWFDPVSRLKHDGSVQGLSNACEHVGEVCSSPCESMRDVVRFMRNCHPDEANATCGLHVHYSFKNRLMYASLMERNFQDHFFKEMEKWIFKFHPNDSNLANRLYGRNQYCRREWLALRQILAHDRSDSPRYTHWNYCFNLHGTVECRMLPMFPQVEQSVAAVRHLTLVVNTWLRRKYKDQTGTVEEVAETDPEQLTIAATDRDVETINLRAETFREKFLCV